MDGRLAVPDRWRPDGLSWLNRILHPRRRRHSRTWVFSTPGTRDAVEHLRLLFSAQVSVSLGLGPLAQCWHVRLGDGLIHEASFGTDVTAAAVAAVLADVLPSS